MKVKTFLRLAFGGLTCAITLFNFYQSRMIYAFNPLWGILAFFISTFSLTLSCLFAYYVLKEKHKKNLEEEL